MRPVGTATRIGAADATRGREKNLAAPSSIRLSARADLNERGPGSRQAYREVRKTVSYLNSTLPPIL